MILKVKHEELKKVKDVMKNDGELLDNEIAIMLEQLEKLKTIWQGQDSDVFCSNVYNYVTRMKTIPSSLRVLSEFIGKADNKYIDNDDAFSQELKTEVDNYDEQDSNNELNAI